MKNSLSFLLNSAEYFLVVAILIYWYSTSNLQNPVAIGFLLLLIFQIFFRNKFLGIIIPCVLTLLSLYMLLALNSELNEFKSFDNEAQILLLYGLTLFIGTIIVSMLMLFNYIRRFTKNENLIPS